MMFPAMEEVKKGKVSEPVDLSSFSEE